MYRWSELARWERWEKVNWHGRRAGNVMRWQFGRGGRVSKEGGMEFKNKIVLCWSSEAKCKQGFTVEI